MRVCVLVALLTAGCAHPYFSGSLDLGRVEKGEIFAEVVPLEAGVGMQHCVGTVDAPPWQVLNAFLRVEDYPLWNPMFAAAEVVSRDGDLPLEVVMTMKPVGALRLAPMHNRFRVDMDRGEISIAYFGNEWLQNAQTVVKATPLGDGSRTLLTVYSTGQVRLAAGLAMLATNQDRLAQMVLNLRKVVSWPQFAERRIWRPGPRAHVAVPNFRGDGVSDSVAGTLTRVFAEELMHSGRFDVSTPQEQAALLHYSAQQNLVGCDPSQPCGLDLGKVLGAQRLVAGTVSHIGSHYILTVSLMTVPAGSIDGRATGEADSEEALMKEVPSIASRLLTL